MTHILLDTNAYTGLMNGDTVIYDRIAQADIVYMSVIILGELYGGSKPDWNIGILKDFLEKETIKIIDITHETSKIFGRIKNELRQKAKMIPINDIWIAAQAIETNSILLTHDKHFTNISNLKMWT